MYRWPLLLILAACKDAEKPTDTATSEIADLWGCQPGLNPFDRVEMTDTEMATVKRLQWESSIPLRAQVISDVGRDVPLESPLPEKAISEDEVLILGIPYQRDATIRVVAETDDGTACSDPLYHEQAILDEEVPEITLSAYDPDQAEGGFTALALITETQRFATILDEYGEVVWNHPTDLSTLARVSISQTDTALLYLAVATRIDGEGRIIRVGLDGDIHVKSRLTGVHKDFVELPDGGLAAIGWDLREFTDDEGLNRQILGDSIVEVDAEGVERVVWSAFDVYEPDLSVEYSRTTIGADKDVEDWSHGNGLAYDAVEDDYLISLSGLDSLVRVDRATGQTVWVLSDTHGDFSSTTGAPLVQGTHSAQALEDNRILLFNRNIYDPHDTPDDSLDDICSEAIEIQLDPTTGEATEVWSYRSEECILVVYFGQAARLDNDNTLVIFSSSGQVSEATPEGETVWQVNTDVGGAFGFGERRDSLYSQ